MAQRTEKEETEFKAVPETITLCINNCGVTGNPATNNMCQKCFNATTAATSTSSSSPTGTSVTIPHNFAEKLVRSEKSARFSSLRSSPDRKSDLDRMSQDLKKVGDTMMVKEEDQLKASLPPAKREVNRCSGCRRKVGLTGFRCRCGELFCGEHRYSDRHDCSYDYKTAGREAIARENPVVKAAKIIKVWKDNTKPRPFYLYNQISWWKKIERDRIPISITAAAVIMLFVVSEGERRTTNAKNKIISKLEE